MDGLRTDLVRKAILSSCTGDCEWVDDKTALRVGFDSSNAGLTAPEIKELTKAWVAGGGAIFGKQEDRVNWRHKRDFVYWIVIEGIDEFPKGFFVEIELTDDDPDDPMVSLLNAHPSSFS